MQSSSVISILMTVEEMERGGRHPLEGSGGMLRGAGPVGRLQGMEQKQGGVWLVA
jgi:hypothetical protein